MPRRPGVNNPAAGTGLARRGLFVALCLLPLFFSLGNHEIAGDSEARYGLVARGMAFRGASWWVPTLLGEPHLTKPPLTYWLHAVSLRLFGDHLWALRLPGALCGALTLGIVYATARRLHGPPVAAVATGLLAVTPLFVVVHRMALTDGPLTLFSTAVLAAAVMIPRSLRPAAWIVALGMATALGLLTKGPAALLAPAAATLWLGCVWQTKIKYKIIYYIVLLISCVPLALWVGSVAAALPGAWGEWRFQTWDRAIGRGDHPEPWWFFVPVFALGLLPMTTLLPWRRLPAVGRELGRTLLRGVPRGSDPADRGLWVLFAGLTFVVFSLISGKLMSYLVPIAPAVACLAAPWLVQRWDANRPRAWRPGGAVWLVLAVAAWCFAAVAEDRYLNRHPLRTVVGELQRVTGLTEPRVYTVGFTDRRLPYHTNRPTARIDPRVLPEAWAALPRHDLVLLAEPEAWAGFADDPHWDLETLYESIGPVGRLGFNGRPLVAYRPLPSWRETDSLGGDAELGQ
ncbi:MAG: glycosyltransferase family 39 protein [Planctomycetota bacterium]